MASSVLVAVRKAVADGLETAIDDSSVLCSYAYEGHKDDSRRVQVFTRGGSAAHAVAALKSGRNFRDESMDFDVIVLVKGVSQDADVTDTQAMVLGEIVEEFIADRKNNELDVPGLQWIKVSRFDLSNLFNANGTITELTYTLTYQARLT